jgi:AGCS family alanine or glycine:cation symporter
VASLSAVNSIIIGMYALMAVPTMTSTIWLAGEVHKAANTYFAKLAREKATTEAVGIQS